MPLIFRWNGYRFHFFSNEGDPREPVHVHVTKGRPTAKFWLHPQVNVAYNKGFPPRILFELVKIVEQRQAEIEGAWHDHFA